MVPTTPMTIHAEENNPHSNLPLQGVNMATSPAVRPHLTEGNMVVLVHTTMMVDGHIPILSNMTTHLATESHK